MFAPILVISTERRTAAGLAEVMRGLGPVGEILWAGANADGWRLIEVYHPKLVFIEQAGRDIDGLALTKQLRHSPLPNRQAPVILISDEATIGAMRAAQNAGAHEFLIRPFSALDLSRRLEAVCGSARLWIEASAYIGPDRRRFNSAAKGPERRTKGAKAQAPTES
jgi:DNA-binding response OmpR family regulator